MPRILKAVGTGLSRLLCPSVHRDKEHFEERYRRLWRALDDGRTWLGVTHPEPASFAQRLIDEDYYYWTSQEPLRRPEWTWQAPRYVTGISAYRDWLDTKPFAGKAPDPVRPFRGLRKTGGEDA